MGQNRAVITRKAGYLRLRRGPVPPATEHLHAQGFVTVPKVFAPDDIQELAGDIERVFAEYPPDVRLPGFAAGRFTELSTDQDIEAFIAAL